jgi:HlyD family secretion protein
MRCSTALRAVEALVLAICFPFLCAFLGGCERGKPEGFVGSGTLEATEVSVSAQTGGQVLRLAKREGDAVAAGDTLAIVDVEKLELERRRLVATVGEIAAARLPVAESVKQARETLENAEKTHRRIEALHEAGTATQQQYDDVSTKYRLARSQLAKAKAEAGTLDAKERTVRASIALLDRQIRDGAVTAPVPGVVAEKYVEAGEIVPPGGAVYKIADLRRFWLKVYVGERDLGRFVLGAEVRVEVDAMEKPLRGTIAWVSPAAEFTPKNVETRDARAELVYAVKVNVEDPPAELKIGMPAEVYLK